MFEIWEKAAKEITRDGESNTPNNAANYIELEKGGVAHASHAGEDRSERAYGRHKACEHNSLGTVLLVERFGTHQMLWIKEKRILLTKECGAKFLANPVAGAVAQNCGDRNHNRKRYNRKVSLRRNESCRKEETVAREYESEGKTGFRKYDCKKPEVACGCDQLGQRHMDERDHVRVSILCKMNEREFNTIAEEEWMKVPARWGKEVKNVALLVEDEPREEIRRAEELEDGETLLGLYQGIPLPERGSEYGVGVTMPDTITLYRLPLIEEAEDMDREFREAVRIVIRETLWHELAHYFGHDDAYIHGREDEGTNRFDH